MLHRSMLNCHKHEQNSRPTSFPPIHLQTRRYDALVRVFYTRHQLPRNFEEPYKLSICPLPNVVKPLLKLWYRSYKIMNVGTENCMPEKCFTAKFLHMPTVHMPTSFFPQWIMPVLVPQSFYSGSEQFVD